jgi:PIN domain nuclease of toxin-antitoxin system
MLPIARSHLPQLRNLTRHHSDSFDHLIIAQAICESLATLTADDAFQADQVRLALEG